MTLPDITAAESDHDAASPEEVRRFGLIGLGATAVFGTLAWYLQPSGKATFLAYVAGIIFAFSALAAAWPAGLGRRAYRIWMTFAEFMGAIVQGVVLGAVYLLVFLPMAVIYRLVGRDPLTRRFDRSIPTYWSKHAPPHAKDRYTHPF